MSPRITPRITPFGRALWHIETHFNEALTQGGVAQIAGVSRFHLTRALGLGAGMPLVKYLRGRRLTAQLTSGARPGRRRTRHPGARARGRVRLPRMLNEGIHPRRFTAKRRSTSASPPKPSARRAMCNTSISWSRSEWTKP